jgi:hypothetical protein
VEADQGWWVMAEEGMEPGFYQARLKGRKTGRVAPRDAVRAPRYEAVLAKHGLMESGKADPNQGQLFNPDVVLGPAKSDAEIAREKGAPPPLAGSAPGFMPGIERKTDKATKQAKITGIKKLQTARERQGTSRGDTPLKETMEDRQANYDKGKPTDWYMQVGESGDHVVGESAAMRAMRKAAPSAHMSGRQFVRTVAITSPRTKWNEGGAPGTTDFTMPNIESSVNVGREVAQARVEDRNIEEAAGSAAGPALDTMKAKAGRHLDRPVTDPIEIKNPSSQKVPNFEQALLMGTEDKELTRTMAGSYTVDAWDARSAGAAESALQSDAGYAALKMTGRRAALKNWELPSNFQSRTWEVERNKEPVESMGENRLFVSGRGGSLKPNPSALPDSDSTKLSSQFDSRSPRAKELGLEF